MTITSRTWTAAAAAVLVATSLLPGREASAQAGAGVYAYPLQGQSQELQQRDQLDCHNWSVSQTGFDPINSPRPAPGMSTYGGGSGGSSKGFLGVGGDKNVLGGEGNVLSDAATGAAFGAIGGAIAGDAGMGAAIGAGASALFGGILRGSRESEEESWRREQQVQMQRDQASAEQRYQEQLRGYRAAYGSCMSARQYRVQ
jgi:hypothetical protein